MFNESFRVIVNPSEQWSILKNKSDSRIPLFSRLLIPWLLILLISVIIGKLLFRSAYGIILTDVLVVAVRKTLLLIMTFLASIMILYETSRKFRIPIGFETSRRIVAYSMLPLIMVAVLTALFPFLRLAGLAAFYSLYLLYIAPQKMYEIDPVKNLNFYLILITGTFLSYLIISILLHKLTVFILF